MNVWRLVVREIAHRKLNFLLGLLSVAVAVGSLVGAMTLVRGNELRTGELLAAKQADVEQAIAKKEKEVAAAGAALNDAMRKITKGLGFNILILPQDQDLNELHVEGTASKSMPEKFVTTLAESRIVTINHLLPIVTKKLRWEEYDRTILLTGTRGEVPQAHRDPKKPLLDHVPAGTMVLGYQLHKQAGLKVGDTVTLMDREFKITETYPERGTADDSTAWVNLAEAQEMLGMQNLVNAILALECNCATVDRLAEIRNDIAAILPGTQVIERGPPALARAEARNKAQATAAAALKHEQAAGREALEREAAGRQLVEKQTEDFAAVLVPVVMIGCGVWIGFLALMNVRQRSNEIGILRAIGLKSTQILLIFLGKAILIGLAGALLGYAAGYFVGVSWSDFATNSVKSARLFEPRLLLLAVIIAPLLSGLASWLPAMLAARQDPAIVLQGD
jgi:putative ABC transport system permease protein